ncbi:Ku protein [Acetobacter sp.]|uniref:non-homologous end joining protein Ku n=1 Tax=Acetobacter sp. TaxID=440 RepID=UPI0039EABFE8
MVAKPFWTGHLKLSLVTCAVSMIPATTQGGRIVFHTVNRRTGHRVLARYVDARTQAPVPDDALVMGYERTDGQYVLLEDAELEAVALDSTHVIEIEKFVGADDIGWIWYDTPHYLMPDDAIGAEAFAVIREAMQRTGTRGIGRLVLYRREHAVLLEPRESGLVVWTLRYGTDVHGPGHYVPEQGKITPDAHLADRLKNLIERETQPWSRAMIADPVQERLKQMIAGERKKTKSRPRHGPGGQVSDREHGPTAPENSGRTGKKADGPSDGPSGGHSGSSSGALRGAPGGDPGGGPGGAPRGRSSGRARGRAAREGGPGVVTMTQALRARLRTARKERGR